MLWGEKVGNANLSYSTLSDDVLAGLAKGGDERAFNELVLRYLGRIRHIARKYNARGYEQTDFVQEGLLGLFCAVKTYDPDGERSFRNYALLVAERRFISVIRKQTARKAVPENALVDMDALDDDFADTARTPEEELMLRECLDAAREKLRKKLSPLEFRVFSLYQEGLSYEEIAERLSVSRKTVDNALQRAKAKIGSLDMS